MKRLLVSGLIAATVIAAALLQEPGTAEVTQQPALPTPGTVRSTLWYCSGATAESDPVIAATALEPARFTFSLPQDGGFRNTFDVRLGEGGTAVYDVGDGLRFHPGPAFVEVSRSRTGVAVLFDGPGVLAGDTCRSFDSSEWYLGGGSVAQGDGLVLRLFNPLLEPARVLVEVVTEFGFEPVPGLEAVSVPARSWEEILLHQELGVRQQIAASVIAQEGVIVPSFVLSTTDGVASWPGSPASTTWEFPIAGSDNTTGVLALRNPTGADVTATIDVVLPTGTERGVMTTVVPDGLELQIPLSELGTGPFGVRVVADGLLGAAVVSRGAEGQAGTSGLRQRANEWVVPVAGAISGGGFQVWVMNTGEEDATVIGQVLGVDQAGSVTVRAGTIQPVVFQDDGSIGMRFSSDQPVTVAWRAAARGDVAYGTANAVDR